MFSSDQVKEASYKKLCERKNILTVNGKFPGPTIEVEAGETIIVDVFNRGKYNVTLHWYDRKFMKKFDFLKKNYKCSFFLIFKI